MKPWTFGLACLAIWGVAAPAAVRAGMIALPLPSIANGGIVGPGVGAGTKVVNSDLTGKNNDNKNVKGDSFISFDINVAAVGAIDIVFQVANTGGFVPKPNAREDLVRNPCGKDPCGTTEYWWESFVSNQTPNALAGLTFQVGFGTGAGFVASNLFDFLDFDTPDKDPAPNLNANPAGFTHNANQIDWVGVLNAAGAFFFMFDVPDASDAIPSSARITSGPGKPATGYRFTIRIVPQAKQVNGQCGPAECDDANPCTDDGCTSTGGGFVCSHTPNTSPCSDGEGCTRNDRCTDGQCVGSPRCHFECYELRREKFVSRSVDVDDRYGSVDGVFVQDPVRLCAPADKNGEDPMAPADADHLTGYRIQGDFGQVVNVHVVTQFGETVVDLVKRDRLLVPSAKSLTLPAPPAPAPPSVDHFQCYRVRRGTLGARFRPIPAVQVTDQFGSATLTLKKPYRLCAPADKNDEAPGAEGHPNHLLCYQTKKVPFGDQVVHVGDQFGALTRHLLRRQEFCVPAVVLPHAGETCPTIVDEFVARPEDPLVDEDNGLLEDPEQVCTAQPSPLAQAVVAPTTAKYTVTGDDLEAACKDVFATSGPQGDDGKRYGAQTRMTFTSKWHTDDKATDGKIDIVITAVEYTIAVVVPDWTPPAADKVAWDKLAAEVKKHEDGHVTIFQNGMEAIIVEVVGVTKGFKMPAGSTDDVITAKVSAVVKASAAFKAMDKANKAYDAPFDQTDNPTGTNHGTENGQKASWPI